MATTNKMVNKETSVKTRTHTLYSYVKPTNGKFARKFGKEKYGSYSAYIDALIEKDRGQWSSKVGSKRSMSKAG
jgi:hypothetical protein